MPRSVCVSPGTEERRREDKQLESRSRQKWGSGEGGGFGSTIMQHPVLYWRLCARKRAGRMVNWRPVCMGTSEEIEKQRARAEGEGVISTQRELGCNRKTMLKKSK